MILKIIQILIVMIAQNLHTLPLGEGGTNVATLVATYLGGASDANKEQLLEAFDLQEVIHKPKTINAHNSYRYANNSAQNLLENKLVVKENSEIALVPNPAQNSLQISYYLGINSIIISDALGKDLITLTNYLSNEIIPLNNIGSGFYIVKIKTSTNQVIVKRLIISK